jgi:cell division protein FtsI/penicillin-binding protein 2
LQARASTILERAVKGAAVGKGAIVVTDARTGALLASVTYPFRGVMSETGDAAEADKAAILLLDRARYGLYPPGSSFKLVTAAAALESGRNLNVTYNCRRLPDGRVGNIVKGWRRPVRDDVKDQSPHGDVDLRKGLVVSCNAYFAQLGTYLIGAPALRRTAEPFGIRTASPDTDRQLRDSLPQASYGQGQVTASPLQMARIAATIANDGVFGPTHWVQGSSAEGRRVFRAETARQLGGFMREVVVDGTGRRLNTLRIPVAGKTGTAELRNARSHAWFVGFAPYGNAKSRIAFAVLVENGGYGGQSAAAAAGELVEAAAELGLIEQ